MGLTLCVGIFVWQGSAQEVRKPFSKEDIVGLLKGGVSPKRAEVLGRQRGIDFQMTPDVERELRRAGATDELIATFRQIAPAPKVAQIAVGTAPEAQVYLDDVFKGQASPEGRLVIDNPSPGTHTLRVSLAGKKDFEQQVAVVPGKTENVRAELVEMERPGTVRENPKDRLKYVWIPPGTFMMGCSPGDTECGSDEKPSHQVTITKGFWVGQMEVTAGAYERFAASSGRQMPNAPSFNSGWADDHMPVVNINWGDAQAYCTWAGGRLPTEAQWEYAARGGSTEARYGSIDDVAWYEGNSGGSAHQVAQKRANAWGLFDTLGNVWEWVNDWYDPNYYQNSPTNNPQGPATGTLRVLRGGSWNCDDWKVRVPYRDRGSSGGRGDFVGFRCVREAAP